MKLKNVTVTGFKSFKKTENLLVDEKITILIGANDHGKTNLLQAILRLNDEELITAEDVNVDLNDEKECTIEWKFTLTDQEIETLRQWVEEPSGNTEANSDTVNGEQLLEVIENIPHNNENIIEYKRTGIGQPLDVKSVPLAYIPKTYKNQILGMKPKIELFVAPESNVKDKVTIAELDTAEFEFMQGIFRLAGLWEGRSELFKITTKTTRLLDEASEKLTKILNDQWNQGKDLKWKLKHVGNNGDQIEINILDPAIDESYSKPSLRSSGFQTFFLLSMITGARTENAASNSYIFLFDEPGTYLHPRAQLDLQRSFEVISDATQLVYTTHSLFLINKNYPKRNRVVSKTKNGSLIDQKPFLKNWKSLRESIGILMSNNFLIAEKTLIVEGPSDVIYILSAIKQLKAKGAIDIDLNDLSIVDAGDEENYIAMTKLMLSEGRSLVALLDGDEHGKNVESKLKQVCQREIDGKKLQIHKLPHNKSTEDVMTNFISLKKAIQKHAMDQVDQGYRRFVKGIKISDEIASLKAVKNTTLGRRIEDITKKLFDPEEKLSKLNIALVYEDVFDKETKDSGVTLSPLCKHEITGVKEKLEIKGERAVARGVFEEVE